MDEQTAEKMAKVATDNLRLRDEVKKLKARRESPGAAVLQDMQLDLDRMRVVHDERLGELDALQKKYGEMRDEWEVERAEVGRLEGAYDDLLERLQRPPDPEPPPEWMRELWSDIYKHAYVAEVKVPAADADTALSKAKARFAPEPLDTPEDTDES